MLYLERILCFRRLYSDPYSSLERFEFVPIAFKNEPVLSTMKEDMMKIAAPQGMKKKLNLLSVCLL